MKKKKESKSEEETTKLEGKSCQSVEETKADEEKRE